MIAIIDYDAGNLKSVEKALLALGEDVLVTRDREKLLAADKVILPGVGNFGDAMEKLKSYGLVPVIHELAEMGKPFLGICLGLQLLFERSDEAPGVEGLGILKGEIVRIPDGEELKVPHIGWNSLHLQNDGRLFRNLPEEPYVYFVHSYYLKAEEPEIVKATHRVRRDDRRLRRAGQCVRLPVPSGEEQPVGLKILENFAKLEG